VPPRLTVVLVAALFAAGTPSLPAQSQTQEQNNSTVPAPLAHRPPVAPAKTTQPETISLTIPKGTSVQVVLDKEIRVKKAGQPIRGHVVEPVYAFDKLVVPLGTEVTGKIARIGGISTGRRALSALDADFTPTRQLEVEFDRLLLPSGKRIQIKTSVTPDSGRVVQFIPAASRSADQQGGAKDAAAKRTTEAKQAAKQQWNAAMKDVKAPGKIHRLKRYTIAQLPVHPQYMDAGTVYLAELEEPLDFGSEPLSSQTANTIVHSAPPDGSVVEARLLTPLSSATSQQGDQVEAVVAQPLFDKDHQLIVPQGSMLKGTVLQVQPARMMSRNGEIRPVFHELTLPDGVEQKVEATLAGVQADKADNLKLDSEGGAQATTSKVRYLQTGVSLGLGAISLGGDSDAKVPNPAGNTTNRVAGGAGGFKVVGITLGILVHSRAFGYSMGAYGAGMSVYSHFMARGRDVVFPKNTAMVVGIGTRTAGPHSGESDTVRQ
jgi:hypothetical protein